MKRIIVFIGLISIIPVQNSLKCVYIEKAINGTDQPNKTIQDEFVFCILGNRSALKKYVKSANYDTWTGKLVYTKAEISS